MIQKSLASTFTNNGEGSIRGGDSKRALAHLAKVSIGEIPEPTPRVTGGDTNASQRFCKLVAAVIPCILHGLPERFGCFVGRLFGCSYLCRGGSWRANDSTSGAESLSFIRLEDVALVRPGLGVVGFGLGYGVDLQERGGREENVRELFGERVDSENRVE